MGVHAHEDRQREPGRSRHPGMGRQPLASPRGRDPPFRARVDGASRRARPIAGRGRGSGSGPSLPPRRPAIQPVHALAGRGARAVRSRREREHSVADAPRPHARPALGPLRRWHGRAGMAALGARVGRARPSRARRAAAHAGDDDCALRTRSARDCPLLRLAGRRSACRRPPAWPRQPHGSDEPRERDRRRRGRGATRRVRGARRDRTSVVPPKGGAARPRAAGRRRPAGCGRRRAVAALERGPPAGRGHGSGG